MDRTVKVIEDGGSAPRFIRLMEISDELFAVRTIRVNSFSLWCMLFSMKPEIIMRNFSKLPLGNEILLELPAMACETTFFPMPDGMPLQITENQGGLVAQILSLIDNIGCGIESAPSDYIERTLRIYALNDTLNLITDESTSIDCMEGSYLFEPGACLRYGIPWLALICESIDPSYLIISHDYIFRPRQTNSCPFYIVIISGDLFGIELPGRRFVRYEDGFDLAVDCAYLIRNFADAVSMYDENGL
jgi:hypothetical protein